MSRCEQNATWDSSSRAAYALLESIRPGFGVLVRNPSVVHNLRAPPVPIRIADEALNHSKGFYDFTDKLLVKYQGITFSTALNRYRKSFRVISQETLSNRIPGNFTDFATEHIKEHPEATAQNTWEAYRNQFGKTNMSRVLEVTLDQAKQIQALGMQSNMFRQGKSRAGAEELVLKVGVENCASRQIHSYVFTDGSPFMSSSANPDYAIWAVSSKFKGDLYLFKFDVWKTDIIGTDYRLENLIFWSIPNDSRIEFSKVDMSTFTYNPYHNVDEREGVFD